MCAIDLHFLILANLSVEMYINLVCSEGFINLINKPTRITSHLATQLDHIYTNILSNRMTAGLVTFEISDHLPTFCMIPRLLKIQHQNIMRSLKYFNVDKYVSDVTDSASLTENLSKTKTMNVESLFNTFFHSLKETIDKPLPPQRSFKKKNRES